MPARGMARRRTGENSGGPSRRKVSPVDVESLDEIAQSIWEDMLDVGFNRDSCAAAARIGIDVLQGLGYRGKPVPVAFNAMNQELVALLSADVPMETIVQIQTPKDVAGGPWWLTIGEIVEEGHQGAGHVVIHIPELAALVDVTAAQGDRPLKAIRITEPIVVSLDAASELVPGRVIEVSADDGVRMWYEVVEKRAYLDSPNWAGQSMRGNVAVPLPKFAEVTDRQVAKFAHLRKG